MNSKINSFFNEAAKSDTRFKFFFDAMNNLSILFDISNIVVSRAVTKDNKQFFNDFVAAWTLSESSIYEHILNSNGGGSDKAKEITDEFQEFVDELIVELNKN